MGNFLEIIGKRFLGYFAGAGLMFLGYKYLDGVSAAGFADHVTVIFGVYVAGQTTTDSVAFLKNLKTLIRG